MSAKWWQKSVIYQAYPQSFNDSNDDGIGDLKGLEEKIPYLHKLGIDVIWLNPIYQSPLVDNGYDISNYEEILPQYGTKQDFQDLLATAHAHGIKIILDLVINTNGSSNHVKAKIIRMLISIFGKILNQTVQHLQIGVQLLVVLHGNMSQVVVSTTFTVLQKNNQT